MTVSAREITPELDENYLQTPGSVQSGDDRAYWVAMGRVRGVGPVRQARLREHFGTLEAAWRASQHDLRVVLDSQSVERLVTLRQTYEPESALTEMIARGIRVLTLDDQDYPRRLREIPAPPPVIFARGAILPEDAVAVAIVGTRRLTSYGREMARRLAAGLAEAGVTVISGLALGIDGAAHRGCLEVGGRTLAVLGCGVDVMYPASHRALANQIIDSGALLSEYPPDRKPDPTFFLARNRIISGMSLGTVVVEAPTRSGALNTANFAADQGREVFVVPGSALSLASEGCNRLLRDGARPITSAEDILEDLNLDSRERRRDQSSVQAELPLDDGERKLLALLTSEPQHIDEIAAMADLPIRDIGAQLTLLELKGLVRNTGAQHYARVS